MNTATTTGPSRGSGSSAEPGPADGARPVPGRDPADPRVGEWLAFPTCDLPTRDKLPVIQELMRAEGDGLALDVGSGTGYTTSCVFGAQRTVCVDLDLGNLRYYRERVRATPGARRPLCVVAEAGRLPFKAGSFRLALCSEVLEHLDDDRAAAAELARTLGPGGRLVVTVPYTGLGFTSFLELLGIPTVHDFPGPERHVRRGYDETSLAALLVPHGFRIVCHAYWFRFFTRLATDLVSLAHLAYQRLVHGRRAWTWADAAASVGGPAFRLYRAVFPLLSAVSRLDRMLQRWRGFGLAAVAVKR